MRGRTAGRRLEGQRCKRRGIDRARKRLKSASDVDVSDDPGWAELLDLENIRNFVVHAGGMPGHDTQSRGVAKIADKYAGKLWFSEGLYWYNRHLVVTLSLGRDFVEAADGFFRRTFPRLGLSVEGVRFVK